MSDSKQEISMREFTYFINSILARKTQRSFYFRRHAARALQTANESGLPKKKIYASYCK